MNPLIVFFWSIPDVELNTLTLYLAAGGLSLCLSLILIGFAHFQKSTPAIRSSAAAILLLGAGFLLAGIGPLLPRWSTVIGTNMLLLCAGVIFYSGFSAVFQEREPSSDRFGWAVVLLTALPFWYWGLIEPNGQYRSAVFSFAAALINGRTGWLLVRAARQSAASVPVRFLALLFVTLAAWMLARSILVLAEPIPVEQTGANPTSWITVFWYIVLISLVTAAILWMETPQLKSNAGEPGQDRRHQGRIVGIAYGRLSLLWAFVTILCFAALAELVVTYGAQLQAEQEKLALSAQLTNDAFVEHTLQVVNQVDILIKAARGYYERTESVPDTERFVATLGFRRDTIEDIYLISADGFILTPWADRAKRLNVAQRDYFLFHQTNTEDKIHIGPIQLGQVTGKQQFRISRRINHPDGSFAGIILIPVEPKALSSYYRQLIKMGDGIATLIGTEDRKIRARIPETDIDQAQIPVESPLWAALAGQPEGSFQSSSQIDQIERQIYYKRVDKLPLVMLTGFSEADLHTNTLERTTRIALGGAVFLLVIVAFAAMLTLVLRQREEQARLLAQLMESNERNAALFNATHDAVILLDGERSIDCNPQALHMFGAINKEESLGLSPWSPLFTPLLQADGTESAIYAQGHVAQALRYGTDRFEFLYKRIDTGEEFLVDIMLTAIQLNGKALLQAVLRDITERSRFEREIKSINTQLTRRNEEQDRFLSMLSHELKTPLAVIRMSLGAGGTIDAASRTRLIRAVADINAIVERCLQSGRLEHGAVEITQTACNLGEMLRQFVDACNEPERVCFEAAPLPDCVSDAQLLTVILTNLIDNALKYSPTDAPVNITAEPALHEAQSGLSIVVTNRPGMAGMPDPQQVFHRYYRAPGAHGKTGSGLGLHIAEGFARMLGGKLSYHPEANTVSFTLWIPQ